jgi:hypothetical protein
VPVHATRRRFLASLVSGTAFVALGQVRPAPALAERAAEGTAERFFGEREREVLAQIAERICDTGAPDAPALRETGALDTIDALCAGLPAETTEPLGPLLVAWDWLPIVFDFTFTRFTRMTAEQQDAVLRGWMTSRFALRRQAFLALRNLAFAGWYSQPEVWRTIGYRGPLLGATGAAGATS